MKPKKMCLLILLAAALLLSLTGCRLGAAALAFTPGEVSAVVMYRYSVPADTETCTLSDAADIRAAYDAVANARLATPAEETAGGQVYGFRFCLADGTVREVTFVTDGGTKGTITLPDGTSRGAAQDFSALWAGHKSEALTQLAG